MSTYKNYLQKCSFTDEEKETMQKIISNYHKRRHENGLNFLGNFEDEIRELDYVAFCEYHDLSLS